MANNKLSVLTFLEQSYDIDALFLGGVAADKFARKDTDIPTKLSQLTNDSGYTKNAGTVTSVAMTVPTGLTVSGSPITSSGTLAVTLTKGYSIPTTAKQTNWDTAYGWGNHASAGYSKFTGYTSSNKLSTSYISGLAKVATSGSYNDLTNKPTIPSAYTLPTASSTQKGGIKVGTGLSISSEKLSVSYGTSANTAAAGNDSRFGKVGVSEAEYRSEDPNPAISYYKLGLINSGQDESNKGNDLSVASANLVYNSE